MKTHVTPIAVIGAMALSFFTGPIVAHAQTGSGPVGASSGNGDPTQITLAGQMLFRIRSGVGSQTAAQRAQAIQERLVPILSMENLTPADITVRQTRPNQDAAIYVRDKLLVTVDRTLAQGNGDKDPGALARTWADRARSILPNVNVKPNPGGP